MGSYEFLKGTAVVALSLPDEEQVPFLQRELAYLIKVSTLNSRHARKAELRAKDALWRLLKRKGACEDRPTLDLLVDVICSSSLEADKLIECVTFETAHAALAAIGSLDRVERHLCKVRKSQVAWRNALSNRRSVLCIKVKPEILLRWARALGTGPDASPPQDTP